VANLLPVELAIFGSNTFLAVKLGDPRIKENDYVVTKTDGKEL
jgi:hypothetical protein